jgi:hypothetical protein
VFLSNPRTARKRLTCSLAGVGLRAHLCLLSAVTHAFGLALVLTVTNGSLSAETASDLGRLPGQLQTPGPNPRKLPPQPPNLPRAPLSVTGKFHNSISETAAPLTLVAGLFNATVSHLANSDPKYGVDSGAFADRFAASYIDIATQNFFGDFVMASVSREDPRYVRRGPQYRFWSRARYAITRAFVIRTDAGGSGFNWSNLVGTAMSAGLSNAYYPRASRTGGATALHFVTSWIGTGLGDLAPEFWPDFQRHFRLFRHP